MNLLLENRPAPALTRLLEQKPGIALLERMSIIEFSLLAHITGDESPLTCSPNQRRNMALLLADVAASFMALAAAIDPLAAAADLDSEIRWAPSPLITDH